MRFSPKPFRNRGYIRLDFTDTIIRARILLDKVAVLSRYFVDAPDQWPVRSFADQCKKFKTDGHSFNKEDPYVKHVSLETDWFEIPLKLIRDDYIVHRSRPHLALDGLHWGENNQFTDLNFIVMNHCCPVNFWLCHITCWYAWWSSAKVILG